MMMMMVVLVINVIFQHSVALYMPDVGVLYSLGPTSFTMPTSYPFIGQYMFRPDSSDIWERR
jgi:hypothetical protein